MNQSANSLTTSHAAPCKSGAKVVECDQTSVSTTFIMSHREEVRRPLQRPFRFLLQVRYNNGNRIGCSISAVFARRRGLGIPSLPRLARSKWQTFCTSAARRNTKGGPGNGPTLLPMNGSLALRRAAYLLPGVLFSAHARCCTSSCPVSFAASLYLP